MDIERFREHCLSMGDVTEKTPFGKFARKYESILVFYTEGHMFCFIDMDDFSWVTVKSTPEETEAIRMARSSVRDPLNQSLRHWIRLDFGGDIPDSEIRALVGRAYEIVKKRYAGKRR